MAGADRTNRCFIGWGVLRHWVVLPPSLCSYIKWILCKSRRYVRRDLLEESVFGQGFLLSCACVRLSKTWFDFVSAGKAARPSAHGNYSKNCTWHLWSHLLHGWKPGVSYKGKCRMTCYVMSRTEESRTGWGICIYAIILCFRTFPFFLL